MDEETKALLREIQQELKLIRTMLVLRYIENLADWDANPENFRTLRNEFVKSNHLVDDMFDLCFPDRVKATGAPQQPPPPTQQPPPPG